MRDIRHIIVHTPGPLWKAGVPIFQQEGVQQHIEHFRQWFEAGKLALGGPFLDAAAGGMMIPAEGLTAEEIKAFADADPTVVSGLLRAEVREWMVGMKA
ncbi:MAG: YciI family protein [Caldimonas sp.]